MRWAILLVGLGCGGGGPAPGASAPEEGVERDVAREHWPEAASGCADVVGYFGRVEVGGRQWVDVVVHGPEKSAREMCEAALREEMRLAEAAPESRPSVARECARSKRADVAAPEGAMGWVLIDKQDVSGVLLGAGGACTEAARTSFIRYREEAACEADRKRLDELHQKEQADGAAAVDGFLKKEAARQQTKIEKLCPEAAQKKARCDSLDADLSPSEKAPKSPRCEKASERALERDVCEMTAARAADRCKAARVALRILEERQQAKPPPPEPPPRCHPE